MSLDLYPRENRKTKAPLRGFVLAFSGFVGVSTGSACLVLEGLGCWEFSDGGVGLLQKGKERALANENGWMEVGKVGSEGGGGSLRLRTRDIFHKAAKRTAKAALQKRKIRRYLD